MGGRIPSCPRCRKKPVRYREHMTAEIRRYEADPDGRPGERAGAIDPMPEIVVAVCVCGHEWCPRGVHRIQDLREA